jgi:hypothetical protein
MSRAGFEPAIPIFERPKTVLAATETGLFKELKMKIKSYRLLYTGVKLGLSV